MNRIRLVTLNIAHGRGLSLYQGFQSAEKILRNLERVARFIDSHNIDIIALQEIDEESHWNKRINLIERLNEMTALNYHCLGVNNRRSGSKPLAYGNAILSRFPIHFHENRPFGNSTLGEKGFLYADVEVGESLLPIVNLHLDFRSRRVRLRQIGHLLEYLTSRGNLGPNRDFFEPIICGDFNSRSTHETDAVRYLFREVEVHSGYELLPQKGWTFPSILPRRGLDFVMLPRAFQWTHVEIVRTLVSDHLPVLVEFEVSPLLLPRKR